MDPQPEGDTPAAPHHTADLGGGQVRLARELHAAGRRQGVELGVAERHALGVDLLKLDLLRGQLARRLQQPRGDVAADHAGAARVDAPGRPSGAGRQVENALAGARIETVHTMLDEVCDLTADAIVARSTRAPARSHRLVMRLNLHCFVPFKPALRLHLVTVAPCTRRAHRKRTGGEARGHDAHDSCAQLVRANRLMRQATPDRTLHPG